MSTPSNSPSRTPGPARAGRVLLVRHGATAWSVSGRHTGSTDVPLTEAGEAQALTLPPLLRVLLDARERGAEPALVMCSPRSRALRTAELAGLGRPVADGGLGGGGVVVDDDLAEWDYGAYEGLTTPQIRAARGDAGWRALLDGVEPGGPGQPPGEDVQDVAARAARVLERVRPVLNGRPDAEPDGGGAGDVVLVAHGHLLRVLSAVWLQAAPERVGEVASHLLLDTAAVCVLDTEHGVPGVRHWNLAPALFA